MKITEVIKRDFSTKPFHLHKITNAILKAMTAVEHGGPGEAEIISNNVHLALLERKKLDDNYIPTVEEVQDFVENKLMEAVTLMLLRDIFYIEMSKHRKENRTSLKSE